MLDMVYFGEARVRKVNCSSFFRFLQDCKVVESKMCKEGNDIHFKSRFVCVVKTLLLKILRKKMCKKHPKSPIKDDKNARNMSQSYKCMNFLVWVYTSQEFAQTQ